MDEGKQRALSMCITLLEDPSLDRGGLKGGLVYKKELLRRLEAAGLIFTYTKQPPAVMRNDVLVIWALDNAFSFLKSTDLGKDGFYNALWKAVGNVVAANYKQETTNAFVASTTISKQQQ